MKGGTIGLRYSFALIIVVSLVMFGAFILNVQDITWALVAGVVCTELDPNEARSLLMYRILATIIGVVSACLVLFILGPGYHSVLVGICVITLICHYLIFVKNSWKFSVSTGVMVLIAGLQQNSLVFAEQIALKRAAEVIAGSLIAGFVSWFLSRWSNKKTKPLISMVATSDNKLR